MNLIQRYLQDVWQILTHPAKFFRRMPLSGGVSRPLAFALVTHWVGSAVGFLWATLIGGALRGYLDELTRLFGDVADVDHPGRAARMVEMRDLILNWMWGTGSVLVDPFLTLLSILFTTCFVFVGARLLVNPGKGGAPEEITFESALRIVCFGMTPAILSAVPLAGGVLSSLIVAIVTVIGAREVYRVDTSRAIVIALFPKILFLGVALSGLFFLFLLLMKFLAMAV